jgi:hypothetical protein
MNILSKFINSENDPSAMSDLLIVFVVIAAFGIGFLVFSLKEFHRSMKVQKWAVPVMCRIIDYRLNTGGIGDLANSLHSFRVPSSNRGSPAAEQPTAKMYAKVEYVFDGKIFQSIDRTVAYPLEGSRPPVGTQFVRKILPEEPHEPTEENFIGAAVRLSVGLVFLIMAVLVFGL